MPIIDCDCPDDRMDIRKFNTGARDRMPVYREQCQICGLKHGPKLNPLDLPNERHPKTVKWAIPRRMKKRPSSLQRRRTKKRQSGGFQAQRLRVMERDHYECQGCGEDQLEELEVHHVSYPDVPEDDLPDSEFQTVCGPCNMAERNERMAGGEGGRVGL